MNNFMGSHNTFKNESAFNKGRLVGSNQSITYFNQSVIKDFGENFETAIQQTNRPDFFKRFSFILLRDLAPQ